MEQYKEQYLAHWMAGKMSDDQLKQYVTTEDFLAYQKLKWALDQHNLAAPNLEENYLRIQNKISQKKKISTIKVFPIWQFSAVAASLMLLFGWYQVFYFSNEISSDFGMTETISLQDQSVVTLNAKSTLAFPNQFQWTRTLTLDGEAFFEVEKGSSFVVKTNLGLVKVLGTKFNVNVEKDFFEVHCFEGKVEVSIEDVFTILTPHQSIRFDNGNIDYKNDPLPAQPSWMDRESSFVNVPFEVVVRKWEKQFQKEIEYPKLYKKVKFTGNFSNSDFETALKSITIPLRLNYSIQNQKITLSE